MAFKDKARMIKYNNQFSRENYDRIGLMVPKGQKDAIKAAAASKNQSVNQYIQNAVAAQMSRDAQSAPL